MKQIKKLKTWFENLSLRERGLFSLMVLAIIYALFGLLIFRPISSIQSSYNDKIKDYKKQVDKLQLQINAVDQIANSPLYNEWKKQKQAYKAMQGKYRSLVGDLSPDNWYKILQTIVESHPNISLVDVQNSDVKQISADNKLGAPIYQQDLTLVINGDYFSTIKDLQQIEDALPNVHWDTLKYEVISYPLAKTIMEFSVFYDKKVD